MIDFEAIAQQIFDAAVGALGEGALMIEASAKQKAPVRRLFSEDGQRTRYKSIGEIQADRALRAQLGLGPEASRGPHRARTAIGKRPPVRWHQRTLPAAEAHLEAYEEEMASRKAGAVPTMTMLSRRGAYEVRTKRAVATTWKHRYLGGRLRGEISATAPQVSGRTAEAWVISPTPYAKYMEFGTRHNAAYPFLRPAADESREAIVSRIAAAVREASRMNASSTDIEIVVRL